MAITDQQFEAWLRAPKKWNGQPVRRSLLVEAKYYPSGGPEATAYMVHGWPFTSRPADTPASQHYEEIVVAAPSFIARIPEVFSDRPEVLRGFAPGGWGDLILDNSGGARDAWLNHGWDGRALSLYLGDASWPKSDFRTILVGYSADIVAPARNQLALRIRDKLWATNVPLQKNRIGGTTDNKDDLIPLAYGTIGMAEPRLTTVATHEYQVHDGPLPIYSHGVQGVRENGGLLSKTIDISAVDTVNDTITTSASHGFNVDSRVKFITGQPSDFTTGNYYWIVAVPANDKLKLSHTRGGAAIDITDGTTGGWLEGYNWWTDHATGKFYLTAAPAGRITCNISGAVKAVAAGTISAVNDTTDTLTFSAAHGAVSGDRIVFAGTVPGGITAGVDYWVLSSGLTTYNLRVSATYFGPTVDITSTTTGATATRYPRLLKAADIANEVLTTRTALTASDLDSTSFADFNSTCPQTLGRFVREFVSVGSFVDEILASVGGFWTPGPDGKLYLGRFEAPSGAPAMEIQADEIARGSFRILQRILPIVKYTLGYERHFTVLTDGLASGLTESERTYLAREYLLKTASGGPWAQHLLAQETPIVGSLLAIASEAATEVARRGGIWSTLRYIYELRCFAAPLKLRLGQVIKIYHSRFGFSAGKLVTIVGMRWAPTRAGGVILEVFA